MPMKEQLPCKTICNDCAFHVLLEGVVQCIHPDELEINYATVTFCNSFQPMQEVDSPCVTYGEDEVGTASG
jgi:putative hydrolase of HD superfamily